MFAALNSGKFLTRMVSYYQAEMLKFLLDFAVAPQTFAVLVARKALALVAMPPSHLVRVQM